MLLICKVACFLRNDNRCRTSLNQDNLRPIHYPLSERQLQNVNSHRANRARLSQINMARLASNADHITEMDSIYINVQYQFTTQKSVFSVNLHFEMLNPFLRLKGIAATSFVKLPRLQVLSSTLTIIY